MRIAVAREVEPEERRVASVPDIVARFVRAGIEVCIEAGAGVAASFADAAYLEVGARVIEDASALWRTADILLKVRPPTEPQRTHEVTWLRPGAVLIGFLNPLQDTTLVRQLAEQKITSFSMELMPRLSRAQTMDALSSQATVAGYKAVLMAADAFGRFFPMLTTAAGTIAPAKVFVLGAGVAGLMAIATARRLGAVVEAFDIRPAVREEVQSLGAIFVGIELEEDVLAAGGYAREVSEAARQREQDVIHRHVSAADVVITAAQVPGRRAPVLVTEAMMAAMRPGSVLVDLAAEQGGNCACTEVGQEVIRHGVKILGWRNLPSMMPMPASQMYARNLAAFLQHILVDGALRIDLADEITRGACVTHDGTICHEAVRQAIRQHDNREGRS
jgi:NAD(P) transhydrogenase subunit alpha